MSRVHAPPHTTPPPPTTSTGGEGYIDICIYAYIYILYTFALTYYIRIHTHVCTACIDIYIYRYIYIYNIYIHYLHIYIYINNLHIHIGTISGGRGAPPDAGPYVDIFVFVVGGKEKRFSDSWWFCECSTKWREMFNCIPPVSHLSDASLILMPSCHLLDDEHSRSFKGMASEMAMLQNGHGFPTFALMSLTRFLNDRIGALPKTTPSNWLPYPNKAFFHPKMGWWDLHREAYRADCLHGISNRTSHFHIFFEGFHLSFQHFSMFFFCGVVTHLERTQGDLHDGLAEAAFLAECFWLV